MPCIAIIDFPNWLDGMGLKGLAPYFKNVKLDDILKMTNWKQLRDLGVSNPAHRKRLIRNIWKAKRALACIFMSCVENALYFSHY